MWNMLKMVILHMEDAIPEDIDGNEYTLGMIRNVFYWSLGFRHLSTEHHLQYFQPFTTANDNVKNHLQEAESHSHHDAHGEWVGVGYQERLRFLHFRHAELYGRIASIIEVNGMHLHQAILPNNMPDFPNQFLCPDCGFTTAAIGYENEYQLTDEQHQQGIALGVDDPYEPLPSMWHPN